MRIRINKKIVKLGLTLGFALSCAISSIGITYAMPNVKILEQPKNLQVTKSANNNYNIQVGVNSIPIGSATTSFTPVVTFPCWKGYAWNAQLGLTMAVTGNAIATAGMTSSFTATTVTASNSYFGITYGGTPVKAGFNETGGLDINITIKRNIGTTLAFGYNSTNVNAYLQPSLTKEWTVGQDLGNGNTVTSVTDTDVTDNLGNNVAHRPDYVVNSIAFMHSSQGGMVSDVQAATGLTTGQIGMLYRMKAKGANGVEAWQDWSIPNGTNLWLNLNTTGMTYPITLSPAGDTFGYTTLGSSTTRILCYDNGLVFYDNTYTPSAGTGTSISIGGKISSNSALVACGLYTYTSSEAGNKLTNGTVSGININSTTSKWWSGSFSSAPTLAAVAYYLGVFGSGWFTYGALAYNSGGLTAWVSQDSLTYPTFPSSVTISSFIADDEFSIYCTYTAGGGASISNTPSSKDFGIVKPLTTYYAYGSAPSNPVTDGQCTFTITNNAASSVNIAIKGTDATGGTTWSLITGTPADNQIKVTAYASGTNPASGVVLTTSNQSFCTIAGSGTKKWDFSELTGGQTNTFSDSAQKTFTITLTGS